MKTKTKLILSALAIPVIATQLTSCGKTDAAAEGGQFTPKQVADTVATVLRADRTVYARDIVTRLKADGVITAHEEWKSEKKLLLPAQMFRAGAEEVDKMENKPVEFSYSLQSLWPLNVENAKKQTPSITKGLQAIVDSGGENFYGEEELGGQKYFFAIYPDKAVAKACWQCHNDHENRKPEYPEFAQGDVMGGVVIRLPIK
jgi:hypothetical protein